MAWEDILKASRGGGTAVRDLTAAGNAPGKWVDALVAEMTGAPARDAAGSVANLGGDIRGIIQMINNNQPGDPFAKRDTLEFRRDVREGRAPSMTRLISPTGPYLPGTGPTMRSSAPKAEQGSPLIAPTDTVNRGPAQPSNPLGSESGATGNKPWWSKAIETNQRQQERTPLKPGEQGPLPPEWGRSRMTNFDDDAHYAVVQRLQPTDYSDLAKVKSKEEFVERGVGGVLAAFKGSFDIPEGFQDVFTTAMQNASVEWKQANPQGQVTDYYLFLAEAAIQALGTYNPSGTGAVPGAMTGTGTSSTTSDLMSRDVDEWRPPSAETLRNLQPDVQNRTFTSGSNRLNREQGEISAAVTEGAATEDGQPLNPGNNGVPYPAEQTGADEQSRQPERPVFGQGSFGTGLGGWYDSVELMDAYWQWATEVASRPGAEQLDLSPRGFDLAYGISESMGIGFPDDREESADEDEKPRGPAMMRGR